jgi:uracil-DNA glycosylase family 4
VTTEAGTPFSADAFAGLCHDVRGCHACEGMSYTHALGAANGPLGARALFVAEAPGRRGAAITGVPLTRDESGRRFERFLALAGLRREEVFVTNAVVCHPVSARGLNRRPSAGEVARCRPYLARTIEVVGAAVVVALGRVALEALRAIEPHNADLRRDVGRAVAWGERTIVPLYHPGRQSTLHRAHNAQERDWRELGEILASARAAERAVTVPWSRRQVR